MSEITKKRVNFIKKNEKYYKRVNFTLEGGELREGQLFCLALCYYKAKAKKKKCCVPLRKHPNLSDWAFFFFFFKEKGGKCTQIL